MSLQQCASHSTGAGVQLFASLVQTLMATQCAISPPEMWPADYGKIALEKGLRKYDFIVVGAGTAGCVLANRLSENPDWKVLLLEAGGDPPIESEIPSLFGTIYGTKADWKFSATPKKSCKARINDTCSIAQGKLLGGTSAINGMLYTRGNKANFDAWFRLGNVGWDYKSVLPYFKKSEGNQHVPFVQYKNGFYHNASGPWKIDFFAKERMDAYRKMFMDAAKQAGHQIIDDINADTSLGYLEMQAIYSNGRRQSAAKAFLLPAMNRTNLHIIKHALVKKVLINSNNEAYGVEFVYNETHKMRARARKEVILAAGTYMSPVLLMSSGIGPKAELEKFDILVKADLSVGENLLDHGALNLWFKFNPSDDESPTQQLEDIFDLAIRNTGMLASRGTTNVNGFLNPLNGSIPTVQIQFFYYKRNVTALIDFLRSYKAGIAQALIKENENHDVAMIGLSLLQPKSKGRVILDRSSSEARPFIIPEYFTDETDVKTTIAAIKQQISFINTPAYQENGAEFIHIPIDECDCFHFQSDEYFRCYITYLGGGNNHPIGTSKMTPDADGVVDPRLRVKNIKNLRQADAGVMPMHLSGNIMAGVVMIAEKAADMIKQDHGFIQ